MLTGLLRAAGGIVQVSNGAAASTDRDQEAQVGAQAVQQRHLYVAEDLGEDTQIPGAPPPLPPSPVQGP